MTIPRFRHLRKHLWLRLCAEHVLLGKMGDLSSPGRDLALKNWDIYHCYQLKWGIYPAIRGDTDHFFVFDGEDALANNMMIQHGVLRRCTQPRPEQCRN